jgi:Ca-activated chloride channel homolog
MHCAIKRIVLVGIVALLASAAAGQNAGPVMLVRPQPGKALTPLELASVDTQVRIVGRVAETSTTMTFSNPHNRVLEGEMYFPLPQGATVSGYALDIKGKMVDGVAIEKHRGREVFEKIVRQGIDPGLVEWAKGNNFKTRVFPIPAGGQRTIRVSYVSEIVGAAGKQTYHLPLKYKTKVAKFALRVEVVRPIKAPQVTSGELANFSFGKWADGFAAETKLTNATLNKDMVIALPDVAAGNVLIEKADDGKYYFAAHDTVAVPERLRRRVTPKRVCVLWDASASRANADHKREIALLAKCLDSMLPSRGQPQTKKLTVDLIVFRNKCAEPRTFTWTAKSSWKMTDGKWKRIEPLITAIKKIQYDGGTQMGAITPWPEAKTPDMHLLFSDGISNFGLEDPGPMGAPVYAFSADAGANHSFLAALAMKTGGRYFNLKNATNEQVAASIGRSVFSFLSAGAVETQAAELYPSLPQPIQKGTPFTLVGQLRADAATVTLNYGFGGKASVSNPLKLAIRDAVRGNLLRKLWAQKKLADLMVFQEKNEKEIRELGKAHGLVTPYTSLIVLDSLEQYIEHRIAPPRSLPKMRSEYMKAIDTVEAQRKKVEQDKLTKVRAMWKARLAWWNKEFKYPKGFKYVTKKRRAGTPAPAMVPSDAAPRPTADGQSGTSRLMPVVTREEADRAVANGETTLIGAGGGASAGTLAPFSVTSEAALRYKKRDVLRRGRPGIVVKPWDPKTPYLADLKAAKPSEAFDVYMTNRKKYGTSPAFFLDCADFFYKKDNLDLALQILSNIAEMELENPALLRILGYKLTQQRRFDLAVMVFEQVLKLRPEEPQSYRDCALALSRRAFEQSCTQLPLREGAPETGVINVPPAVNDALKLASALGLDTKVVDDVVKPRKPKPRKTKHMDPADARAIYAQIDADNIRAIELLYKVVTSKWDGRFNQIEVIALTEMNRIMKRVRPQQITHLNIDKELRKLLRPDIRIVMTWDADNTDMDLHVVEPSGEEVYYSHNLSTIGGAVSRDITRGYGPEEYMVRKAMHGVYTIKAKYYGSSSVKLMGSVTVKVDIYTDFGGSEESHKSITVQLKGKKEMVTIGQIEF